MKIPFSSLFKKEYIILYLIIFIGAFLRLQGTFTNSFAFTYDVGRDMLELSNIVYLHKIPLIGATTGLPGVFYGPWWYYMLSPFFILFSGDPQGIAFVMGLIGILTIVLGYLLGKKIAGNFLGLTFALLIGVSGNLISLSSQIWNPNIAPAFVILVFLVLYNIYTEDVKYKFKYYFLLGILLFLNIDLEIVFGLLFLLGTILSILIIVNKRLSLKYIASFALGGLIILSPRIFFEFRHQFLMTKSLIKYASSSTSSHASNFLNTIIEKALILFDQFNSTLALNNKFLGVVMLIVIVILLALFYKTTKNSVKNILKTSIVIFLVFLAGTVFFSHDIWPHYLVGVPILYIIIFGICLYLLSEKLLGKKIALLVLMIVGVINFNPVSVLQNMTKPIWEGDASVYRNQLEVVDYIYKNANGRSFKYVVYTPPIYDYTYQYLFKWYGFKKYHYLPSNQANLAYFILEPDMQYSFRLSNWLKNREKDGTILNSQTVKGGIIVQTRKTQ